MTAKIETVSRAARGKTWSGRRIALVLGAVAIVFVAVLFKMALFSRDPIEIGATKRSAIAEGVELLEAGLSRGGEPNGRIVGLYVDPRVVDVSLVLNDGQSVLSALAPDALAVVNAGYFTKERKPTGLLVSQGRVISPFVAQAGGAGSGVFLAEDGRVSLIERDQARATISNRSFSPNAFAIQAGPRIIEPGGKDGIIKDDGAHANRTVIGADDQGRMIIAVVLGPSGWPSGPTLFEVQRILGAGGLGRIARDLAFQFALNLDGGPSTGMHVRSKEASIDAPESAPVLSVIALRPKR